MRWSTEWYEMPVAWPLVLCRRGEVLCRLEHSARDERIDFGVVESEKFRGDLSGLLA